mmetsp:Transcript_27699/g.63794  ORF Transcript_27699/g.63794 Transcript_27699/m.63794 type:complete len:246 (-) Transcript_27699:653-1390(-)
MIKIASSRRAMISIYVSSSQVNDLVDRLLMAWITAATRFLVSNVGYDSRDMHGRPMARSTSNLYRGSSQAAPNDPTLTISPVIATCPAMPESRARGNTCGLPCRDVYDTLYPRGSIVLENMSIMKSLTASTSRTISARCSKLSTASHLCNVNDPSVEKYLERSSMIPQYSAKVLSMSMSASFHNDGSSYPLLSICSAPITCPARLWTGTQRMFRVVNPVDLSTRRLNRWSFSTSWTTVGLLVTPE